MSFLIRLSLCCILVPLALVTVILTCLSVQSLTETYMHARLLANTSCREFIEVMRGSDDKASSKIGRAFNATSTENMLFVDEELSKSKTSFSGMVGVCLQNPENTLRHVLVKDNNVSMAASMQDVFNTIDGTERKARPMAPELYVNSPENVSQTQPVSPTQE